LKPYSVPVASALPSVAPRRPLEYTWRRSAAGRSGTRPCAKPCSARPTRHANAGPHRPNRDHTFVGDAIVLGARPRSSSAPLGATRGSGAVAVGHSVPGPVGGHARHGTANAAAHRATGRTAARVPRAAIAEREQRGTNSKARAAEKAGSDGLSRGLDMWFRHQKAPETRASTLFFATERRLHNRRKLFDCKG
jgi:hypothetical protein